MINNHLSAEVNMISETDREFVNRVREALESEGNLRKAAEIMGEEYNTVYQRLRRLGYKLEQETRIVPIHADAA